MLTLSLAKPMDKLVISFVETVLQRQVFAPIKSTAINPPLMPLKRVLMPTQQGPKKIDYYIKIFMMEFLP